MEMASRKKRSAVLSREHYDSVFNISNLPDISNPLVIISGTAAAPKLENERKSEVITAFGKVKLRYGSISNRNVVLLDRHNSTGRYRAPDSVPYRAHAVTIAALEPSAIVTLHALGADPGKLSRVGAVRKVFKSGRKPGELAVIKGLLPGTARSKTIFPKSILDKVSAEEYNKGFLIHAGLPNSRLCGPSLKKKAVAAIRSMGGRFAKPIVVQTNTGPEYESSHQVKAASKAGADAFAMTHAPEVVALAQALKARGSDAELLSLGLVTNYPEGLAKELKHEEVAGVAEKSGKSLSRFFSSFVKELK